MQNKNKLPINIANKFSKLSPHLHLWVNPLLINLTSLSQLLQRFRKQRPPSSLSLLRTRVDDQNRLPPASHMQSISYSILLIRLYAETLRPSMQHSNPSCSNPLKLELVFEVRLSEPKLPKPLKCWRPGEDQRRPIFFGSLPFNNIIKIRDLTQPCNIKEGILLPISKGGGKFKPRFWRYLNDHLQFCWGYSTLIAMQMAGSPQISNWPLKLSQTLTSLLLPLLSSKTSRWLIPLTSCFEQDTSFEPSNSAPSFEVFNNFMTSSASFSSAFWKPPQIITVGSIQSLIIGEQIYYNQHISYDYYVIFAKSVSASECFLGRGLV